MEDEKTQPKEAQGLSINPNLSIKAKLGIDSVGPYVNPADPDNSESEKTITELGSGKNEEKSLLNFTEQNRVGRLNFLPNWQSWPEWQDFDVTRRVYLKTLINGGGVGFKEEYEQKRNLLIGKIKEDVRAKMRHLGINEEEINKRIEGEINNSITAKLNDEYNTLYQQENFLADKRNLEEDISDDTSSENFTEVENILPEDLRKSSTENQETGFETPDQNQLSEVDDLLKTPKPNVVMETVAPVESRSDLVNNESSGYANPDDLNNEKLKAVVEDLKAGSKEENSPTEKVEQKESEENLNPDLEQSPEQLKLNELREKVARIESDLETQKREPSIAELIAIKDYAAQKLKISSEILKKFQEESGLKESSLVDDDKKTTFNQRLFEFYNQEYLAYKKAFNEIRGKNLGAKFKEGLASLLNTKVGKVLRWYGSQNKWLRLGVTSSLFAVGGYAIGAAVVGGSLLSASAYGAGRFARGGASILAGGAARVMAEKKWSEENLLNKVKEEEDKLKNENLDAEEFEKRLKDLRNWEEKERKRMKLMKAAVTIGVGAGAGLLAGLTEASIKGTGTMTGASESAPSRPKITDDTIGKPRTATTQTPDQKFFNESDASKSDFSKNRISRGVMDRSLGNTDDNTPVTPKVSTQELKFEKVKVQNEKGEILNEERNWSQKELESTDNKLKEIFDDPTILRHTVKEGDSTWKILEEIIEKRKDLKEIKLTPAQKTYLTSWFTEKVMKDPSSFGVGKDGSIFVGKQTDFTKLFENQRDFESILAKARALSKAQEESILRNNEKIANWIKDPNNQGKPLTKEVVKEILSSEPRKFVYIPSKVQTVETPIVTDELLNDQEKLAQSIDQWSRDQGQISAGFKEDSVDRMLNSIEQDLEEKALENKPILSSNQIAGGAGLTALASVQSLNNFNKKTVIRTPKTDEAAVIEDIEFNNLLRQSVNNFYNKKKFLGVVEGVQTEDWRLMASRPATNTVSGYISLLNGTGLLTGNPIDRQIREMFMGSDKHIKFLSYVGQLQNAIKDKAGMEIIPYQQENMGEFFKRLFAKAMELGIRIDKK